MASSQRPLSPLVSTTTVIAIAGGDDDDSSRNAVKLLAFTGSVMMNLLLLISRNRCLHIELASVRPGVYPSICSVRLVAFYCRHRFAAEKARSCASC